VRLNWRKSANHVLRSGISSIPLIEPASKIPLPPNDAERKFFLSLHDDNLPNLK
jgi:hypothetical protein